MRGVHGSLCGIVLFVLAKMKRWEWFQQCFSCGFFCVFFSPIAWIFIDVLRAFWSEEKEGNRVREILAWGENVSMK